MIESLMRLLTSLLPLRNIELSDLNLRNPWKSTRKQRRHSYDSMGIQYLKIPRGRKRGMQKLPSSEVTAGYTGAVTCNKRGGQSELRNKTARQESPYL